jgi:flagellar protein FlgJ
MQINRLQRQVQASDLTPEQLVGSKAVAEQDKIAEASRQFEAVLLRQVLADAQKPVIRSAMVKDSTSASIYRDLITNQLADSISKSGSFGLAKVLEPQLQHELAPLKPDTDTKSSTTPAPPSTLGRVSASHQPAVVELPPHAAMRMLQLGHQASPLKSHD